LVPLPCGFKGRGKKKRRGKHPFELPLAHRADEDFNEREFHGDIIT
jgi:hypothetical protein